MFEFFKARGRKTIPKPPTPGTSAAIQIPTSLPVPGLIVPGTVMLKRMKWVTVKGRVGIVTAVDTSGYVKIDLTDKDGFTVESIRVPVGEVKLARYGEIPEARRGDPVIAATLGYV